MANNNKEYQKRWREKNKEYLRQCHKAYYEQHKQRLRKQCRDNRKKRLDKWLPYLIVVPCCEMCGMKLIFFTSDKKRSIFFDHKTDDVPIKENPTHWLTKHPPSPKNRAIWNSCDFGILCNKCNATLPTKNRTIWIKRVIKYAKFKQRFGV